MEVPISPPLWLRRCGHGICAAIALSLAVVQISPNLFEAAPPVLVLWQAVGGDLEGLARRTSAPAVEASDVAAGAGVSERAAAAIGSTTGAIDSTTGAIDSTTGAPASTATTTASVIEGTTSQEGCRPDGEASPMRFGAIGDGRANDTGAVLAAFAHVSRCGGTVVVGPAGSAFLVDPGALTLDSLRGVTIRFEGWLEGPALEAWNPSLGGWPEGSCAYGGRGCAEGAGESPEVARSHWGLLHCRNCSDLRLEGPGGLRAPGRSFWSVRNTRPAVRGYCLLKLTSCERIAVSGLALVNSPMYHLVVMGSRAVTVERLSVRVDSDILGDHAPHNTDGVSIIASEGITLRRSEIESGDDNVVIKERSSDILAEDLLLVRGKGVAIGSLGERAAERQVVRNVVFRNVTSDRCMHGARIKTWKGATGLVRNVTFSGFLLRGVSVGILINQRYCPRSQRPEGCAGGDGRAIAIEDVLFQDFRGTYTSSARISQCVRCTGVRYERVELERAGK